MQHFGGASASIHPGTVGPQGRVGAGDVQTRFHSGLSCSYGTAEVWWRWRRKTFSRTSWETQRSGRLPTIACNTSWRWSLGADSASCWHGAMLGGSCTICSIHLDFTLPVKAEADRFQTKLRETNAHHCHPPANSRQLLLLHDGERHGESRCSAVPSRLDKVGKTLYGSDCFR